MKKEVILAPSMLAGNFWKLGEQLSEIEGLKIPYLHIDVMDGLFVPSISFGMPVIASLRKCTNLFFDVHLMIQEPERYFDEFAKAGADLLNFHLEATKNPRECIDKIRALGKKVGITINPGTPAQAVFPYLELVDMVLVMTVEPGFGGQKLMPDCLEKVREIHAYAMENQLNQLDIEVDGGIKADNILDAVRAGANVIVAGSAVFGEDTSGQAEKLLAKLAENQ